MDGVSLPMSEYQLTLFVSLLAESVSPTTTSVYLAAARSVLIDLCFAVPTQEQTTGIQSECLHSSATLTSDTAVLQAIALIL